jgi:outer membrane biosynthesis protein TonB
MRVPVKYAYWLLPLMALVPLLQGCDHKAQTTQTQTLAPPIVDTPPPKPATVSKADLPPVVIGETAPAKPKPSDTTTPVTEPPKKPVRHPKKPATTPPAATTAPTPTQEAAAPAAAPSVSAIGQLSGGASGDLRSETNDTIAATEKGLNGVTRSLSDQEQKIAAQIREFIKQAKDALTTGDVDGAHTLAMKAKVLLTELNQ